MDIAFSGSPSACDSQTCKLLEEIYPWRNRQSVKDAGRYKYVFDVVVLLCSLESPLFSPRSMVMDGRDVLNV